jgi:hypothetical protein
MTTSTKGRKTIYEWSMLVACVLGLASIGMQCVARGKCPDHQGAHWTFTSGTVCYGDRQ